MAGLVSRVVWSDELASFLVKRMVSAVCTLFEGDYHLGVAALANSLHRSGFRGIIWAGMRGECPAWLGGGGENVEGISIRPVLIPPGWHLSHLKPHFMTQVLTQLQPDAGAAFYFDPDITCLAPWSFFTGWVDLGIALCEDGAYGRLHRTHPFRATWRSLILRAGLSVEREVDFYANAGFIGLKRPSLGFLTAWHAILDAMAATGMDLAVLKPGGRAGACYGTDQDALNAAVMASAAPVSLIGTDGMGFTPAGYVMLHAVDSPKPWRCRYLLRLLRTGNRPDLAHKNFWRNIDGIFAPLGRLDVRLRRLGMSASIAFSRVYRR